MESEREMVDVNPVVFSPALPDIQVSVEIGTGRSNWQQVASQGRLCRKGQWRWYGRFRAGNLRPAVKRQWRSTGC